MGNQESQQEKLRQEQLMMDYNRRSQQTYNQLYSQQEQLPRNELIQNSNRPFQNAQPLPLLQKQIVQVENDITIIKNSIQLIRSHMQNNLMYLTFQYNSKCPIKSSIYFLGQDIQEGGQTVQIKKDYMLFPNDDCFILKAGNGQVFPPELSFFNTSLGLHTIKNHQDHTYPLIIKIEKEPPLNDKVVYIFCSFDQLNPNLLQGKILRQKIQTNGQEFTINEIYGINENGEEGKDCSICLSEKINTVILPCKHMCVCSICCEDLRLRAQKCPICRNVIDSFLRLDKIQQ